MDSFQVVVCKDRATVQSTNLQKSHIITIEIRKKDYVDQRYFVCGIDFHRPLSSIEWDYMINKNADRFAEVHDKSWGYDFYSQNQLAALRGQAEFDFNDIEDLLYHFAYAVIKTEYRLDNPLCLDYAQRGNHWFQLVKMQDLPEVYQPFAFDQPDMVVFDENYIYRVAGTKRAKKVSGLIDPANPRLDTILTLIK